MTLGDKDAGGGIGTWLGVDDSTDVCEGCATETGLDVPFPPWLCNGGGGGGGGIND